MKKLSFGVLLAISLCFIFFIENSAQNKKKETAVKGVIKPKSPVQMIDSLLKELNKSKNDTNKIALYISIAKQYRKTEIGRAHV